MSIATVATEADIFAEVIAPEADEMPPDMARSLLKLAFSESQKEQMRELADKNNRGVLTDAERGLMEKYLHVGRVLNIVHARARISLNNASQNGR